MLVLTRKPGEQIVIGNNIRVTVLAIQGSQIKLGIDAPGDVSIFRSELLEAGDVASVSTTLSQPRTAH